MDLQEKYNKLKKEYSLVLNEKKNLAIRLRKQNNGSNVVRDLHDRQLIGKTWKPEHQKGDVNKYLGTLVKENDALLRRCRALELGSRKVSAMPKKKMVRKIVRKETKVGACQTEDVPAPEPKVDSGQEQLVEELKQKLKSLEMNLERVNVYKTKYLQEKSTKVEDNGDHGAVLQVQTELHSKIVQIQLLETRIAHVEEQACQDHAIQKKTARKLNELLEENQALLLTSKQYKKGVEESQVQKELMRDMEKRISALQFENRKLSDMLKTMSNGHLLDDREKVRKLEHQILILRNEKESLQSQCGIAQGQMNQVVQENEELRSRVHKLRAKVDDEIHEKNAVQFRLENAIAEFADAKLNTNENMDPNYALSTFLDASEGEENNSVQILQEKITRLTKTMEPSTNEIHRLTSIIKKQDVLLYDLTEQVQDMEGKYNTDTGKLTRQVETLKHQMEHLTLQPKTSNQSISDSNACSVGKTSIEQKNITINIHLKTGCFPDVRAETKFCVAIDFLHFESQVSTITKGSVPKFGFCASYNCSNDQLQFAYNNSNEFNVLLQVYIERENGAMEIYGMSRINMIRMCQSKSTVENFQCKVNTNSTMVGTLQAEVLLSQPFAGDIKFKTNRKVINKPTALHIQPNYQALVKIESLIISNPMSVKPYLQFKLFGFPDCFTPIGHSDCVEWNYTEKFPIQQASVVAAMLPSYKLEISAFDDSAQDDTLAWLGSSAVPLQSLTANSDLVAKPYYLKNTTDEIVGKCYVVCAMYQLPLVFPKRNIAFRNTMSAQTAIDCQNMFSDGDNGLCWRTIINTTLYAKSKNRRRIRNQVAKMVWKCEAICTITEFEELQLLLPEMKHVDLRELAIHAKSRYEDFRCICDPRWMQMEDFFLYHFESAMENLPQMLPGNATLAEIRAMVVQ